MNERSYFCTAVICADEFDVHKRKRTITDAVVVLAHSVNK